MQKHYTATDMLGKHECLHIFLCSQLEGEYLAAAKRGNVKRPVGFDLPDAAPATTNALLDYKNSKKNKKR